MVVSLVTGSSTGIGEATALALARAGHHTFASMRNPEAGRGLLETAKAEGLRIEVIALDVTDPEACELAVDSVLERGGAVDVLVNNAGIGGTKFLEDTTDEDWQRTFDTNLFGLVRMTRLVLPGMRSRGSGSIVNISSVAGRVAAAPQSNYAASKWAVEATSEVLAQEVNSLGVQVVVIEPGFILTPIFGKGDPAYVPTEEYVHLGRRMRRMFETAIASASPASDIGNAVVKAIEGDKPFQRLVVGFGGAEFVEMRESMSDEEWASFGREMTDEEENAFFRPILDADLWPEAGG